MEDEISKTIVYENGGILDIAKVRDALILYYQFTKAEKNAFDRLSKRADYEKMANDVMPDYVPFKNEE